MSPLFRRTPRRRRSAQKDAPTQLRPSGLVAIFAIAALAASAGVGVVHVRFLARDREIETVRLQDAARIERDEIKRLEANLGGLRRDENLRQTALEEVGMIEPPLSLTSRLEVDPFRLVELRRAEREARRRLLLEIEAAESPTKEDPPDPAALAAQ